jgi:predicted nucleotidyltransferase
MNASLLDLSGKIDRVTVELFEAVLHVAQSIGVRFFVVGAAARDMILLHGYDVSTIRATTDIDLGVQVPDWKIYEQLKEGLVATGDFTPDREPQQLTYKEALRIDVIPFGAITGPDNVLTWPSDYETKMNMLGFEESYHHAVAVRLRSHPALDVRFASLAGQAVMKIIAWNDDYSRGKRDAQDLLLIMSTYLEAGNQDRLFNEEKDLVDVEDFDYVRAGARLLGRDIAAILNTRSVKAVLEILNREIGEQGRCRLVEDMMGINATSDNDFEDRLTLLKEMTSGILDRTGKARDGSLS